MTHKKSKFKNSSIPKFFRSVSNLIEKKCQVKMKFFGYHATHRHLQKIMKVVRRRSGDYTLLTIVAVFTKLNLI